MSFLVTIEPTLGERAQQHEDVIRRTAYRLTRSRTASQDIAQDVMLRVCRCGGYDSSRGTFDAWLQMMTQSTAIDWIRKEVAHDRRVDRVGAIHSASMPAVEEVVAARSRAVTLRAAVARLPEDERIAISRAYFDELTYRQVAERLEIPEGTVKSRIRRALSRLADSEFR